jgi:hypothetical protein
MIKHHSDKSNLKYDRKKFGEYPARNWIFAANDENIERNATGQT